MAEVNEEGGVYQGNRGTPTRARRTRSLAFSLDWPSLRFLFSLVVLFRSARLLYPFTPSSPTHSAYAAPRPAFVPTGSLPQALAERPLIIIIYAPSTSLQL